MPMTGKQLKRLRMLMGLTQKQLGAELGVTENSVARWERDEMKMRESAVLLLRSIAAAQGEKRNSGRRGSSVLQSHKN
jgi:transcriptional regulator with XRE-family HTH domain